jgi:DNA mismatch endonuclease (patch repair protein)
MLWEHDDQTMDRLTPEARSANMKAIRRKDTAPEMVVRRLLHTAGYRYRLHVKRLPGSPDIVFPGRRKAIFVHGCFWHGLDCRAGRRPQSRQDYWFPKIARNQERDATAIGALTKLGWESLTIWQCEIVQHHPLIEKLTGFLERTTRDAK